MPDDRGARPARAADRAGSAWRAWGPYLSERAWGTVREDYSAHGTRGTTSRTTTPGRGPTGGTRTAWPAVCDEHQTLCLGLALWNGVDPILKERMFGLTGPEGNHGEDAKEYWWYLDSTPTHSWMRGATTTRSGRSPTTTWSPRTAAAAGRAGVRAGRHRRLRRRPLLGRRRRLRQGRARPTCCMRITVENRGPDAGDAARAADAVVPQHLGVGPARLGPTCRGIRADGDGACSPSTACLGALALAGDGEPAAAVLRQRDEHASGCTASPGRSAYPKDGINDHVVHGAATVNPDAGRHQGGAAGTALDVPAGGDARSGCALTRPARADRADLRRGFDDVDGRAAGRGRRVLRRARPRPADRRRGAGAAPGVRRADVGQAVLPLRRRALARRRPGRPAAARGAPPRPQRRLAAPQQPRRDLDAGPVGVPVVRRVGPRLPLRGARPRRPGLRQGPAAAAAARVVHAPQRPAPGVRVGVRRRQPAGARLGGAAGLRDRRQRATSTSSPGSSTSCCSTSPGGSTARTPRATTSSRAASSGWTTSGRSTGPPRCRWPACSSRPTAPPGWRCTA